MTNAPMYKLAPSGTTVQNAQNGTLSPNMTQPKNPDAGTKDRKIAETVENGSVPKRKILPKIRSETNPLPTPIKVNKLTPLLDAYDEKDFVIDGFSQGFDLGYEGDQLSQRCNNNLSVNMNIEAAMQKVQKEVALKRIAGPFEAPPLEHFKCSPLSLREKSTPGQFRLLHNLSYPHDDTAVNANIPDHKAKTTYSNIDDALDDIRLYDSPYLAKTDIADAFRLLLLKPACYNLTGFKLKGEYYYDCCVPMGASSSCLTFERVSDSLVHIIKNKYKVKHVTKVLDDFLFIAETKRNVNGLLTPSLNWRRK